eukprot:TRINITY_DN82342_c0_g1_i1.p1 TRINITY_DN82342_c0_g1~~TRINITY_DN82342_c0_g1_i1.p1  ORF type:complete len:258 (-),score=30.38 TRINITY_DN82342_c0_g1_i1:87-818(-)
MLNSWATCGCCASDTATPVMEIHASSAIDKEKADLVDVIQVHAETYPPRQPLEETCREAEMFDVVLDLDSLRGSTLGLDLSAAGPVCMVKKVTQNSFIGNWNKDCPVSQEVRVCDQIYAVDGEACPKGSDIMDKLAAALQAAAGKTTATFRRPRKNKATLHMTGAPCELIVVKGPEFLLLIGTDDVSLQEYNSRVSSAMRLKQWSRIIAVNGERGNGTHLAEKLREAWSVQEYVDVDFLFWGD